MARQETNLVVSEQKFSPQIWFVGTRNLVFSAYHTNGKAAVSHYGITSKCTAPEQCMAWQTTTHLVSDTLVYT